MITIISTDADYFQLDFKLKEFVKKYERYKGNNVIE